jgi:thioredoxin-related protein
MLGKRLERKEKAYLYLFFILLLTFGLLSYCYCYRPLSVYAQDNLSWLLYEQALTKSRVENIPTLLYFYTDNCGWCRKMEQETFTSKEIKELLGENFSLARINGNSNNMVVVDGKKMTERQLSTVIYQVRGYPTIWFLASDSQKIASLPGYISSQEFLPVLLYIRDGFYKEYTFLEYMKLQKK